MRYDLDLARKILIAVFDLTPDPGWALLHVKGYDDAVVGEHVPIQAEVGLIEMKAPRQLRPVLSTVQLQLRGGAVSFDQIRSKNGWGRDKAPRRKVGDEHSPPAHLLHTPTLGKSCVNVMTIDWHA